MTNLKGRCSAVHGSGGLKFNPPVKLEGAEMHTSAVLNTQESSEGQSVSFSVSLSLQFCLPLFHFHTFFS